MAMAYCTTCGAVGNWVRCPEDGVSDNYWEYQKHHVRYDETTTDKKKGETTTDKKEEVTS